MRRQGVLTRGTLLRDFVRDKSIKEVAAICGISSQAVSNWFMRGMVPPKHAIKLIHRYNLTYKDYFL